MRMAMNNQEYLVNHVDTRRFYVFCYTNVKSDPFSPHVSSFRSLAASDKRVNIIALTGLIEVLALQLQYNELMLQNSTYGDMCGETRNRGVRRTHRFSWV